MGKTLKTIAIVAAAVAIVVFAPQIAAAIGVQAITAATITAIGVSLALSTASMALFGPKIPKTQISRLNVSLDPSTPRKAVFGTTAMPLDLRYHESSGTDQEYVDYIVAVAAHKIGSIDEIWFEEKLAWTAAGGVTGTYAGYLTVTTRTEGSAANYISINGGTKWGSSRRLTGCAYVHLRIKRTGNTKKAESPLVGGLPSRVTVIGDGARLYDPRKDSTVPGGSGSHRATDQATWGAYTNADDTDNPALQLLWWLIGWQINGKLSVGCGVPHNRIDMASFITAANICDENVTLAIGGTQKRYRTSGTASDGDDRLDIINNFLASMNGTLRDNGGKLTVTAMKNDLANYVLTFNESDMLGGFDWQQTRGLTENYNIVRGRYVDPSPNSLYQMVDYPEIELAVSDGIERVMSLDLPYVEDGRRAQRIAKQVFQRNQYRGLFSTTFNVKALGCQVGDVVRVNLEALGWTNKLFRVVSQEIRFDGQVPMALVEENAAIYAWDAEDVAPITPTAPTIYNPLNNPFILGLAEAEAVADGKIDSYYQAAEPTGATEGDYWTDTDDSNKMYRYTSGAWVLIRDTGIPAAITAAAGAQATADGKVTTFYVETAPTAQALGDLWYKPSTKYLSRWNGSAWVEVATVGAKAGTNLLDSTGATLADAAIITSQGTAALIANQAATATNSDFSAVTGTTKPDNNATVGARSGTNLFRTDGTTVLTQAEIRTVEGTAAAIAGQAATATSSDFAAVTGTTKPDNNATVGATWGTNLTGRPPLLTGEGVTVDEFLLDPSVWSYDSTGVFSNAASGDGWFSNAGTSAASISTKFANATPIDNTASYEVSIDLIQDGTGVGTATSYLGVALFDANGGVIGVDGTWWHYFKAGEAVYERGVWETYSVRVGKGTAKPFPANAAKIGLVAYVNYNNLPSVTCRVRRMKSRRVTDQSWTAAIPNRWTLANGRVIRHVGAYSWGNVAYGRAGIKGPQRFSWRWSGQGDAYSTMCGLSESSSPVNFTDGVFTALANDVAGSILIYEGGVDKATYTDQTDRNTAEFAIEYDGLRLKLFKNGVAYGYSRFVGPDKTYYPFVDTYYHTSTGIIDFKHSSTQSAAVVGNNTFDASGTAWNAANGATIGARAGTNLFRTDGATVLSQAEVRTAEGTAAAITGQAATATSSDFSVVTGTTKPDNNANQTSVDANGLIQGVSSGAGTTVDNARVLVGARNLMTNSGQFTAIPNWSSNGSTVSLDATVLYGSYSTLKIVGFGGAQKDTVMRLKPNTQYTVSAMVKGSAALAGAADNTLHIQSWRDEDTGNVHQETIIAVDTAVTTSWKLIYQTFVTPNSDTLTYCRFYFYPLLAGFTLNVGYVKLEEGNKATDWTQAPEELTSGINSAALTANWPNVTGTGKPDDNATVGARSGTNLFRTDGTTVLTQAEIRTAEGTAAAITGQGSLATSNTADWASQIASRPVELTDGRITNGFNNLGRLRSGIQLDASSAFTPAIEVVGALKGTNLNKNPEFFGNSLAGYSVYNNNGDGSVNLASRYDTTVPNGSGYAMEVNYTGGNPTPGYGGFTISLAGTTGQSRPGYYTQNATIYYYFWAVIPVGRRLEFHTNPYGNGGTWEWVSDTAGTGGWQKYIGKQVTGIGGSLSITGYFAVHDGPNTAFTWVVGKLDIMDVSSVPKSFLGNGNLYEQDGGYRLTNANSITSFGTAAAIAGQGSLATRNDVTDSQLGSTLAARVAPFSGDQNYLSAGRVAWDVTGSTVQSLKPAEAGANVTETRTAAAIAGQGALATRNEITASSGNAMRFTDNLIPDNEYRDLTWWGASSLPNVYFSDADPVNWEMPRNISINADRDFDFSSQFFTLEKGSTYRIRVRIWNNNGAAGWSGALWAMIHIPNQAWFSLKHGTSINPEIADANNAIVALGDTGYQDFYFTPQTNYARQIQFRFKSNARGSDIAIQMHLNKVQRLGRDLIRFDTNLPYQTADIQTNLGTASAIAGQAATATNSDFSAVTGTTKPSDNATSDIKLVGTGTGIVITGNRVTRPTGGGNWDSQAYTPDGYVGGAYSSFSPTSTSAYFMAGLNTDPTADASYVSLDFAFYMAGDTNLYIYESANGQGAFSTATADDVLSVVYDNEYVRYLKNGIELRAVYVGAGKKYHFDSSFVYSGLSNIRFGSYAAANAPLSFINTTGHTSEGNTVFKRANATNDWDGKSISREISQGTAFVTGKLDTVDTFIGLHEVGNSNVTFHAFAFSIHRSSNGTWAVYEDGGSPLNLGTGYDNNTQWSIRYDGVNVRYYAGTNLLRTVASTADRSFQAGAACYSVGARVSAIQFGPYTDRAWANIAGTGKPENNADVTITAQVTPTKPDDVIINADYLGAILAGQFNKYLVPGLTRAGSSVRLDNRSSYSISNVTGGLSGYVSVDSTNGSGNKGVVTVTNCTASGTFQLNISWDGYLLAAYVIRFTVVAADAPLGGGGAGGTKSGSVDITGQTVSSTSFVSIAQINNLTKAAGETIKCSLPAAEYELYHTADSTRNVIAKFQYSATGANSWTDVGTQVSGSSSTWDQVDLSTSPGSITVNQNVAPSNGAYDIRLVVARNASGGGNLNFSYGTMAVIIEV